jgi:hypothetical protein
MPNHTGADGTTPYALQSITPEASGTQTTRPVMLCTKYIPQVDVGCVGQVSSHKGIIAVSCLSGPDSGALRDYAHSTCIFYVRPLYLPIVGV